MQRVEPGISGLFPVILFIVILACVPVFMAFPSLDRDDFTQPGGIVIRSVQQSGESIRVTGTPVGYPGTSREIEGIAAVPVMENQNAIGFVILSITPLVGDLAIDTDSMGLALVTKDSVLLLQKTREKKVGPGEWAIVRKYNLLPGKSADADDILEAHEVFEILVSLPVPLLPGQKGTLVFSPRHGMQYSQKLAVPPVIRPVTLLS